MPIVERLPAPEPEAVKLNDVPLADALTQAYTSFERVYFEQEGSRAKLKDAQYSFRQVLDYHLLRHFLRDDSSGNTTVLNHLASSHAHRVLIEPIDEFKNAVSLVMQSADREYTAGDFFKNHLAAGRFLISHEYLLRERWKDQTYYLETNDFWTKSMVDVSPEEFARREAAKYFLINSPSLNDIRLLNGWQHAYLVWQNKHSGGKVEDFYEDLYEMTEDSPYYEFVSALWNVTQHALMGSGIWERYMNENGKKFVIYAHKESGAPVIGWIYTRKMRNDTTYKVDEPYMEEEVFERLSKLQKEGNKVVKIWNLGYVQTSLVPKVSSLPEFARLLASDKCAFHLLPLNKIVLLKEVTNELEAEF